MRKSKAIYWFLTTVLLIGMTVVSYASAMGDWICFFSEDKPISFSVRAEIRKLPQFDAVRTEKLNRLLKHAEFDGTISGNESVLTVRLDGNPLFSYTETELAGKTQRVLAPDPEHPYLLPQAENTETGNGNTEISGTLQSILSEQNTYLSLDTVISLLQKMPAAFPDNTTTSKIRDNYRYYGTAVKKCTVQMTGEAFTAYIHENADVFSHLFPEIRKYTFENRQSFSLRFAKDDRLLSVNYGGKVRLPGDDVRVVKLEWKTIRSDALDMDELTLRTPNTARNKRNNYILKHSRKTGEDGAETFSWKGETDRLADGVRTQSTINAELASGTEGVSGKITETIKQKGKTEIREITLTSSMPAAEPWKGTLEIISKKDKIETNRLKMDFSLSHDLSVPVDMISPEPIPITNEEYAGILDMLTSKIVRELIRLPDEDLTFLKEGLPEDVWNTLKNSSSIKEQAQ